MILVKKHKRKGKLVRTHKRKRKKQVIVGINYPKANSNITGTTV